MTGNIVTGVELGGDKPPVVTERMVQNTAAFVNIMNGPFAKVVYHAEGTSLVCEQRSWWERLQSGFRGAQHA